MLICEACGEYRRTGEIPEACQKYPTCIGPGEGEPDAPAPIEQLPGQVGMELEGLE